MVKKNTGRDKERGRFAEIGISFLRSVIVFLALSVVGALVVYFLKDPLGAADIASLVVLLLSGAISGFLNAKMTREGKLTVVGLSSLAFCLVLLLIGLIATGGGVTLRVFLNYLCYIGVSFLFGWLGSREESRRRR